MFGTPSAPGLTAVEEVADVSVGVGGCAYAYGPGEDERDQPCVGVFGRDDCVSCDTAEQLRRNRQESAYFFGGLALVSAKFPPFGFLFGGIALGSHFLAYHTSNAMMDAGC